MTEASDLAKYASKANAVFNSITANATAITALSVGGASINATAFAGAANSATYANSSVTNTFTVGTAAYFVANGNVGIGTSSPTYDLTVNGGTLGTSLNATVNAFQVYTLSNNADYLNFYKVRQTAANSSWETAAWRIQQVVDVTPQGYIQFNGSSATDTISFGTGNTERMRIDSSGNVGIGNTAPNAKLQVTGTANISSTVIIGGALTSANLTTTTNTATIGTSAYFVANGNVGVGTSSPTFKLVSANSSTDGGWLYSSGATSILGLGGYAGAADGAFSLRYDRTTGVTTFNGGSRDTPAERMRIDGNGNVGIGTSSPGSRLHAYGDGAELRAENTNTAQYASGRLRLKGPAGTARSTVLVHGNDNVGGTNPYFAIEGHNSADSYIKSMALYYHASDYWYFPYQVRAPIFYDSDDTNSYFEGPQLFMRGGSPTMYFRDTDANSAMIHCNGNLLYFLRGATDSTTWTQVSGQWPLYLNLTNNDGVLGGSFYAVGNITAYYSDRRLKTNIRPITGALAKLKQINGVYYNNNDFAKSVGYTDDDEQVGVISQEVEKVLPHVVKRAPFDIEYDEKDRTIIKSKSGEDYMTVQYDRLVPLLIEAIKEQQAQIEELQAKIMEK